MALSIKDPEADKLARELARRQDKSITRAVVDALKAELEREKNRVRRPGLAERLLDCGKRLSVHPTLDQRSEDEILGYDDMMSPPNGR